MSVASLDIIKRQLDVITTADDVKLQSILDQAESEALRIMNRTTFSGACCVDPDDDSTAPTNPDTIDPGQLAGVVILCAALYQASPADAANLRLAAEVKLFPWRCGMGA